MVAVSGSFFPLVSLFVLCGLYQVQATSDSCSVKYFYKVLVAVRAETKKSCSQQDRYDIAVMIEDAMDTELDEMGFDDYVNVICRKHIGSNETRQRRLSLNNTLPYNFEEAGNESLHSEYQRRLRPGHQFIFRGGGYCGYCVDDNFDHRVLRQRSGAIHMKRLRRRKRISARRSARRSSCIPHDTQISSDVFDNDEPHPDWKGVRQTEQDGQFGRPFLGRLFFKDYVARTFNIPNTADQITVMFDLYEIDDFNGGEIVISINDHKIKVGPFWEDIDEGLQSGYVESGAITWSMISWWKPKNLGFGLEKDQKHKFIAHMPRAFPRVRLKVENLSPSGALGIQKVRTNGITTCSRDESFSEFRDSAERRMEARVMIKAYQSFFMEEDHCWRGVFPRVDINLSEKRSWQQADPRC